MNWTFGYFSQILGISPISKSTPGIDIQKKGLPFLYEVLAIKTMFMVPRGLILEGSALNLELSIALGITEVSLGFTPILIIIFSLTA